jgi:hypothetical protein
MTAFRSDILQHLLAPRMVVELETILHLLYKNFDVVVRMHDDETRVVFHRMIRERASVANCPFEVALSFQEACQYFDSESRKPLLCISQEALPKGGGFIERHLLSAKAFLPPLSSVVLQILEHRRMNAYVDVFDGPRMRHLKDVLRLSGLFALVDVVIQVAYLAGAEGNSDAADRYLVASVPKEESSSKASSPKANAARAVYAQKFFHDLLSGDKSPHEFGKASLSYYTVHGMGYSVAAASRALKVSRNTIVEHLALAEQLGVDRYLGLSPMFSGRRKLVG